jgi:hypothetical protein
LATISLIFTTSAAIANAAIATSERVIAFFMVKTPTGR